MTGHAPTDPSLFVEALTHGSHGARDYQRLEFLGDRVLGMVVAEALYAAFPLESEGALSARLNQLVTGACCADVARQLELPALIRLGKQARDDGGRDSDNILGDVMEALIGALFLAGALTIHSRWEGVQLGGADVHEWIELLGIVLLLCSKYT
ncbi:MAG: hypothetical protein HC774_01780 [Sphingomonadales bacterium]|nr:hypothetical protein [Sphingomonadales bacterium]